MGINTTTLERLSVVFATAVRLSRRLTRRQDVGTESYTAGDAQARYETWHGFADGIQEGRCSFGSGNFDADSPCRNPKDDPNRQLRHPRPATQKAPNISQPRHIQATNNLDPLLAEPRDRPHRRRPFLPLRPRIPGFASHRHALGLRAWLRRLVACLWRRSLGSSLPRRYLLRFIAGMGLDIWLGIRERLLTMRRSSRRGGRLWG